jgi:hypothetical protein
VWQFELSRALCLLGMSKVFWFRFFK